MLKYQRGFKGFNLFPKDVDYINSSRMRCSERTCNYRIIINRSNNITQYVRPSPPSRIWIEAISPRMQVKTSILCSLVNNNGEPDEIIDFSAFHNSNKLNYFLSHNVIIVEHYDHD